MLPKLAFGATMEPFRITEDWEGLERPGVVGEEGEEEGERQGGWGGGGGHPLLKPSRFLPEVQ